jgi:hypothetical protein
MEAFKARRGKNRIAETLKTPRNAMQKPLACALMLCR